MPRPVMVHSGTSSRIPIAVPIRNRTISAPSGLELLRSRFTEQLLLEKERKMLDFHRQQQERILYRVRQRYHQRTGPVREFFEERRNVRNHNGFFPINADNNLAYDKFGGDNISSLNDRIANQASPFSKPMLHGRTRSVGRDRSNLLAPINNPRQPMPPSIKKPRMVRAHVLGGVVASPDSKPSLVGSKPLQMEESGDEGYNSAQSAKKAAKTPNGYQAWMEKQARDKELKEKKQAHVQHAEPAAPPDESTNEEESGSGNVNGFRKWQLEQLKAREDRLKQYNEKHPRALEQSEQAKGKVMKSREIELQNLIRQKEQELVEMAQRRQLQKNSPPGNRAPATREAKDKSRPSSGKNIAHYSPQDQRKQTSPQSPPHQNTNTLKHAPLSPSNTRIVSPYAAATAEKPPRPKSLRPPPKLHKRKVDQNEPVAVNDNTSFYIQKAAEAEAEAVPLDLVECPTCGRNFVADRLSKHAKACTGMKKNRKVFDPVKMRTAGTEMQQYIEYEKRASKIPTQQQPQQQQKSSWRAKHQDFIRTIRYAKHVSAIEAQGGSLADLPPPPPSDTSDFTQCPHCQRRFNPRVAERHIPKCKDIKSRPPPPRRGI